MRKRLMQLLTAGLVLMGSQAFGAGEKALEPFPEAAEGMQRFVITLPDKERGEDLDFKVELIPGKIMLTDGVNRVRLGASLTKQTLQGWGYSYYEMTGSGEAMSTMMAAPDGAPQVEAFVAGTSLLISYNSRLPVVVYAPQGYEVRYRVWSASELREVEKR